MSLHGEFCRVLDKYKDLKWSRGKSAEALEKYFNKHMERAISDFVEYRYGKRCKTKDTHDFPELKDDPLANRCLICEAWDAFDKYFEEKNA